MKKRNCGFTIVELAIVVLIIVLMAGLVLPPVAKARYKYIGRTREAFEESFHNPYPRDSVDKERCQLLVLQTLVAAKIEWRGIALDAKTTPSELVAVPIQTNEVVLADIHGTNLTLQNVRLRLAQIEESHRPPPIPPPSPLTLIEEARLRCMRTFESASFAGFSNEVNVLEYNRHARSLFNDLKVTF